MAVQNTAANLKAAILAQLPDNTSGTITPARHRAALADVVDTAFDAGVQRGIVLGNDIITAAMLAAGAADRDALPDEVVNTAKLADTAVTLQKLATNARVAAWATRTGAAGRMPRAQTYGDVVTAVAPLTSGNIVVFTQADGTTIELDLSSLAGGGTAPTAPATRYWGWSTDVAFAASEFTATGNTGAITIPQQAAQGYLAFAIPDDAADLTDIHQGTGRNQIGAFTKQSGTITLASVAHKWWRSNRGTFLPAAVASQPWYIS